jgi:hypothetical protein
MKFPEDPVEEIRRDYTDPLLTPEDFGMTLDPASVVSGRMVANDARARSRKRRVAAVAVSGAVAASVLIFGALQPWRTDPVEASTPRPLSFEHGLDSHRSAIDPLQSLSSAAVSNAVSGSGSEQHVVTARWSARTAGSASSTNDGPISDVYETVTGQDGSVSTIRVGSASLEEGHERDLVFIGSRNPGPSVEATTAPDAVDPDFARNLPSEPDAMRAALLADSPCPDQDPTTPDTRCVLREVNALHSKYVIPSATIATEWDMLANEPGVTYLGRVRDRAGRVGIGIALPIDENQGTRIVLIADPSNGRLLGIEELNEDSGTTAPRKISVFLKSDLV